MFISVYLHRQQMAQGCRKSYSHTYTVIRQHNYNLCRLHADIPNKEHKLR